MPGSIKLVVLDWAGTTVDFGSCGPAGAFVAAFADAGVEVSITDARRPMGMQKKAHVRAMFESPAVAGAWFAKHGRAWGEADVDSLYAKVTPMQVKAAGELGALCPGVIGCVAELRRRGIKVGATTGYFREAAAACYAAAERHGYKPDAAVCADDVSAGRPKPWMIYRTMELLDVYPPTAVVKVGDTVIDIQDGVNSGAWSVGVVDSSNEMGLSPAEFAALGEEDRESRRAAVRETFFAAGADGVIDTLDELPALIDELQKLLGEEE